MTIQPDPPDAAQVLHALRVSDARWQAVLATSRDAVIAIDAAGVVTLFNRAAEAMFGYAAAEVVGRDVTMLMPAPYSAQHAEYLRRYQRTGERHAIGRIRTVQGRRRSGETFPLELSVSESRIGEEILYTAILRDIAERVAAEAAVRTERDFAERLIDTAEVIVLVVDSEGRIVRYNAYMEGLSGRRLDEVVGADWVATFIAARDGTGLRAQCAAAASSGELRPSMAALVTADHAEREIEWRAKTLRDADGRVSGLLCIGTDLTERLAAQRELRTLQGAVQERGRLADIGAITAKVVHDLGNPLAALSMQAQLILRRARRGDFQPVAPVQQPAEQILQTLRRLEGLVREFTDFARDQRLAPTDLDVAAFLRSLLDLWQALAAERGITLRLVDRAQARRLRGDEVMLHRVLDNLIKNAVEAIAAGPGEITIETALPRAGRISIAVGDSGAGVPDGVDVFKLFETTKADGTGIGLAVAKQIVAAHGGVIEHFPRDPRGTTFRIELPIDGPARQTSLATE